MILVALTRIRSRGERMVSQDILRPAFDGPSKEALGGEEGEEGVEGGGDELMMRKDLFSFLGLDWGVSIELERATKGGGGCV